MYVLFGGVVLIFVGLAVSSDGLAFLAVPFILYGPEEMINGSSRKSRYKKMLPDNILPKEIDCSRCGENLELDEDEGKTHQYFCPSCNRTFRYIPDAGREPFH